MPIRPELVDDVSVFAASGVVGAEDIMAAMSEWYAHHPTRKSMYIFSGASLSGLMASDLERLARHGLLFAEARGGKPRTAIVVNPHTADRLIISAFQALQETMSPVQMKLFFAEDEARTWLQQTSDHEDTENGAVEGD